MAALEEVCSGARGDPVEARGESWWNLPVDALELRPERRGDGDRRWNALRIERVSKRETKATRES